MRETWTSHTCRAALKVVLEVGAPEGVYVFAWDKPSSPFAEHDYLQETLPLAMSFAEETFGVEIGSWTRKGLA